MQLNPIRETTLLSLALAAGAAQAQSTLYSLPGETTGDRYGEVIRNAGDVDRDGIEDFVVGTGAGKTGKGYAEVISGANGQVLHTLQSSSSGDWFGVSVSGAGDVNADGHDDLLIGAPLAGSGGSGRAYVYDGDTGALIYSLAGDSSGDHFGWSVAGLPDVDNDQLPDFAVSAVDDDNQAASAGTVRVFSGATGLALYTLEGTRLNELFGSALAGMPDIDGDGLGELIVGAPFANTLNPTEAGEVFVYSGATGALIHTLSGVAPGDAFGSAACPAGDVDGDGVEDLIAGAPQPVSGKRGWARVYSGLDGSVLLDWGGDSQGDRFGSAVTSAGDLNGDGRAELAVGAPGDDDFGSASGSVRLFDGGSGLTIFTTYGQQAGEELGKSLDTAGDLNGDLVQDLLSSTPGMGAGAAKVVSNVALGLVGADHVLSASGNLAVAHTVDFGPSFGGDTYMVLGSITGISQGTQFGNLTLAVNRDRYFKKTYKLNPNGTVQPPTGQLDPQGQVQVSFTPPGSSPVKWLVGQTFHHVGVVFDGQGNAIASTNAWPVTIVP